MVPNGHDYIALIFSSPFPFHRYLKKTSKTEVLQMPSASDVNLGYGFMSPIYCSNAKKGRYILYFEQLNFLTLPTSCCLYKCLSRASLCL